ncbi:MAG: flagellin [Methanospirillum sp.]|uniref:archaellin/type IV pilin N-terminal domain-containing protein n=1 Tax=Methanospirillum sp. TaxID=45200 RepID=UPI00236B27C2|nr:archaellin/type IV pilin N-terminal domain-containing protein [Methanospirillum sp.]MDD1728186.1 flagellin [Methanospirillum sp.]
MKNLYSEDAFTGLEAAIVLIAFVVVAAVFSYVVLGAGFFTTQTAQATVHTGVAQASSSLEIVGNVMGIAVTPTANRLTYINTSIALTAGGTAMDLSQMVISYSDNNGGRNAAVPNSTSGITDCIGGTILTENHDQADNQWCVSQKINTVGSDNNLLEPNEIWVLSIGMPSTASINQKITVNLQPSVGAVLPITRTIPGGLTAVQAIY